MEGLIDRRLALVAHRRVDHYRRRHEGWRAQPCYAGYRRDAELHLGQEPAASGSPRAEGREPGAHRKRRKCSPLPGMLRHQDDATPAWVPGQ
jgi:hypothetical protein